ncbi:hotdog fold domain-containing protein [Isoalcanivorax beigongshangi]|uniref:Hotdog fold domain-containing protein n=1 Tax=Isoalcanivorax beigongshangi TaxID=3238810 RepID=A0ABV4AHX3_9GAMM
MNPDQILALFEQQGPDAFSAMLCQLAPYFATINPVMTALAPNRAEARLPFRREVTNHIGTVHAIAMCNLAELVAGTMTNISVPAGARWIPRGMTVEYVAKARGDLIGVASGDGIDWSVDGDPVVPVTVHDAEGTLVFTAAITMNVKHG